MKYTIKSSNLMLSIDEMGRICAFSNKTAGISLIKEPSTFFRMKYKNQHILKEVFDSATQNYNIECFENKIRIKINQIEQEGKIYDISCIFEFHILGEDLFASYDIHNNSDVEIVEMTFPLINGVKSISDSAKDDKLYFPMRTGVIVDNPIKAIANKPLYAPYPGSASMQWYAMDGDKGGLYMASYDDSLQYTTLFVEKPENDEYLAFGFIKCPFIKKGMNDKSNKFCISLHDKDWHYSAKKYRKWAEDTWYTPPVVPDWVKSYNGWLRVIMKNQYGAMNYEYKDMVRLYEQTDQTNMNTLFILGWIPGGFSKKWPEFVADDILGGKQELKAQVKKIHAIGGRVLAFVSYFIIDPDTDYYESIGKKIALKDIWGEEVEFCETYYDEGTWRKIICGNKQMIGICPSTLEWQDTMIEVANTAMSYGIDGVLYDIGGIGPHLCYDSNHPHDKPNLSYARKADNYKVLRANIKRQNPDAMIAMEDAVDVFGQHMDLAQSGDDCNYTKWYANPSSEGMAFPDMYRYTFPEHRITNRNNGHDEEDFINKIHYAFLYGLKYDMSIFRCKGNLDQIPNYKEYLAKINKIRLDNDLLLNGHYCDNEYYSIDNGNVHSKSYIDAEDGATIAIALWNPTVISQDIEVYVPGFEFESISKIGYNGRDIPRIIYANSIMVLIFKKLKK